MDVSKFGVIWAGAQKNVGPAGVTIVIIREDLIGFAGEKAPVYLDYKTHADNDSMYNTPPCFAIYVAGEVFKHLKETGGVEAMEKRNREKAAMLYDYIDSSRLFKNPVAKEDRSMMNVVFVTGDADLDKKFVAEAKAAGLPANCRSLSCSFSRLGIVRKSGAERKSGRAERTVIP